MRTTTRGFRVEELTGRLTEAALRALRRRRSPQVRLVAATGVLEVLRCAEQAVAKVRDCAIVDLVASGRTYAQLGALSGLTRGRVAQIVNGAVDSPNVTRRIAAPPPP